MAHNISRVGSPARAATAATGTRRVFVRDLEVVTSIGVFEREKRYHQRVLISIDLDVEDTYDGVSDRLEHVLDYDWAVHGITELVQREHLHLIETMAERVADFCLTDQRVKCARVHIEKPDALPSVRAVGIEIERSRT